MYLGPRYIDITCVIYLMIMDTEDLETPNAFAVFLNSPNLVHVNTCNIKLFPLVSQHQLVISW